MKKIIIIEDDTILNRTLAYNLVSDGYEMGGADYFTKPFSVAVLCRKIAAVFETIEQHRPRHDLYGDGFLNIDFSEQTATLGGNPTGVFAGIGKPA